MRGRLNSLIAVDEWPHPSLWGWELFWSSSAMRARRGRLGAIEPIPACTDPVARVAPDTSQLQDIMKTDRQHLYGFRVSLALRLLLARCLALRPRDTCLIPAGTITLLTSATFDSLYLSISDGVHCDNPPWRTINFHWSAPHRISFKSLVLILLPNCLSCGSRPVPKTYSQTLRLNRPGRLNKYQHCCFPQITNAFFYPMPNDQRGR